MTAETSGGDAADSEEFCPCAGRCALSHDCHLIARTPPSRPLNLAPAPWNRSTRGSHVVLLAAPRAWWTGAAAYADADRASAQPDGQMP